MEKKKTRPRPQSSRRVGRDTARRRLGRNLLPPKARVSSRPGKFHPCWRDVRKDGPEEFRPCAKSSTLPEDRCRSTLQRAPIRPRLPPLARLPFHPRHQPTAGSAFQSHRERQPTPRAVVLPEETRVDASPLPLLLFPRRL